MSFDFGDINYLAVVAGIIINMAAGALWYSPVLFSNAWLAAIGKTKEEIQEQGSPAQGYAVAIVASIVIVLAMAVFVQLAKASTWADGLALGLLAGAGFVATTAGAQYAFESRPLRLYLINTGYPLVSFAVIGIVLALWD